MNQFEGIKQFTTIVADSGDIESICHTQSLDAMTNSSLLLKVATLERYQTLFHNALEYGQKQGTSREQRVINACDKLAVNIGTEILKNIPGKVATEINARLAFDKKRSHAKAHQLIDLYKKNGIEPSRILITLTATWEGIRTAEILQKEGFNCSMTLVFSFAQARACAEAGVFQISPYVGRIYDWYQSRKPKIPYVVEEDPGVKSVRNIYNYSKQHHDETLIMGTKFRRAEQILALAGCDRLNITPNLLQQLQKSEKTVIRKLIPDSQGFRRPTPITEADFRWEHNYDEMAVEKLAEGIRLLAASQRELENLIADKL